MIVILKVKADLQDSAVASRKDVLPEIAPVDSAHILVPVPQLVAVQVAVTCKNHVLSSHGSTQSSNDPWVAE
jgi:hypothetical protein